MKHFLLPLFPKGFQEVNSYFPHPSLEGTDLQWLIASWGQALQLSEHVSAAPSWVSNQPGQALLPFSFKRVLSLCAASQGLVFSSPVRGTGCGALPPDRVHSPRLAAVPLYTVPRQRCGWAQRVRLEHKGISPGHKMPGTISREAMHVSWVEWVQKESRCGAFSSSAFAPRTVLPSKAMGSSG